MGAPRPAALAAALAAAVSGGPAACRIYMYIVRGGSRCRPLHFQDEIIKWCAVGLLNRPDGVQVFVEADEGEPAALASVFVQRHRDVRTPRG